ncbi:MAG: trigger factor [Ilumatobacteraceae bacterium]
MRTTIAPTDDTRTDDADEGGAPASPRQLVKLSVVVEADEFDHDIDRAFKKIAGQVRLPGFRNGKAPRKVLEARIGIEAARQEALNDAIPVYLARAVREHDVDLIATPEVELTGGTESGDVSFEAVCEVRPTVSVPGYGGLRVELPAPTATEAEIDEAVEAERRRQGSLVSVDRAAAFGDHVTLDLAAHRDGEPVPGLNTEDWLYEVGKGWVAEGFDGYLVGASAGAELTFSATPTGTEQPADFTVKVSAVQEMALPDVTDAWVADNVTEHETVAAWREAIATRLGQSKLNQARNVFIDRVTAALAELVDSPLPQSMVNGDLQARVQNTVQQFQAQGIAIEQFLQITGQTTDQFIEQLREQSVKAVKVDLALRAVADAEGITVADDDIEAEYARIAMRSRQKVQAVRRAYEQNDAVTDLVAQLRKNKALDWLVEHVELVDPAGQSIDRTVILGEPDHDHDHDHDHGHDH